MTIRNNNFYGGVIVSTKTNSNINNELPIVDPATPMQNNHLTPDLSTGKIMTKNLYEYKKNYFSILMYTCGIKLKGLWIELLQAEQTFYRLLGIEGEDARGEDEPNGGDKDGNTVAFDRYLKGRSGGDYLNHQLPVFYTLLYCHTKEADNVWKNSGGKGAYVSNVLYPTMRRFLEDFFKSTLNMKEARQNEILDSKDDHVVLGSFVTLFKYETLTEKGVNLLNKLNYIIDEEIYKKRYFDWLKEQTLENEVKDERIDSDLFIDRYYVLPDIKPDQLCDNNNDTIKALLTCGPGFGKTSACRAFLAACLCDEAKALHEEIQEQWLGGKNLKELFPIYIEAKNINRYINHNTTLPNSLIDLVFVTNKDNEEKHNTAVNVINAKLKENKLSILMLLDGLDEVEVKNRQILTGLVDSFSKAYTEANIIITSRPINFDSYKYDENNEQTDVIIGLKKHQLSIDGKRIAIVKKWEDILGEDDVWAVTTERKISQNSYLSDLAKNPFLLAHMVLKIAENYEKPYKIIYEVVEKLIEKKRDKNKQDSSLVRKLLSYIAYDLFIKQSNNIPYQDLEKVISYAEKQTQINREEWKRLCEEIITGSGLMICDNNTGTRVYSFQEPIIQKFLAAEWLLQNLMDTYEDTYYEDNSKQKKYIYKENPKLFFVEQIEHRLDDLWKKTDPQTWTDIVTMMMINPPTEGGWRDDFSDIVIEPIFTYLLQTNATSVEPKQIESICKILKAMCLEEFSTSELLMNEDVEEVRNNRIRLLRTLLSGVPGYYEKCCREWEAESKSIQNFYSANETEVK